MLVLSPTFVVGAYLGSVYSVQVPQRIIRKTFGILLRGVAVKMIFSK
ncbi:MAG: hypothetical protein ACOCWD_05555 [Tangfeifania sp.]